MTWWCDLASSQYVIDTDDLDNIAVFIREACAIATGHAVSFDLEGERSRAPWTIGHDDRIQIVALLFAMLDEPPPTIADSVIKFARAGQTEPSCIPAIGPIARARTHLSNCLTYALDHNIKKKYGRSAKLSKKVKTAISEYSSLLAEAIGKWSSMLHANSIIASDRAYWHDHDFNLAFGLEYIISGSAIE